MNYCLDSSPDVAAIHRVVGRQFVANTNPLLSIKSMFGGYGDYTTDNGQRHRIDDSSYLVLNHDHGYTVEKNAEHPVETFCVFFPLDLSSTIAREFAKSDDILLEPAKSNSEPTFNFFEHRRLHGSPISHRIEQLRAKLTRDELDDAFVETEMMLMLADLLCEHKEIGRRISKLPWTRSATRSELYRRIQIARDYIHANLAEPFSISQSASIATLSKYHFLRTFRNITGETPLSYLQRIRVERAKWLLSKSKLSITQVAVEVGYESLPSFSTLFRTHTQLSPSEFRVHSSK